MVKSPSVEDLFEDSLLSLFNVTQVCHGVPGEEYVYHSCYGRLALRLPQAVSSAEHMRFAQYIWNSGLLLAERVEHGAVPTIGKRVLELGAGTGLCGILAALSGAMYTVMTDYPSEVGLNTLKDNVRRCIMPALQGKVSVLGHAWGDSVNELVSTIDSGQLFDCILLADCLWMPDQHLALCQTLCATLEKSETARIHCIAGFHSGRKTVASFLNIASNVGLVLADTAWEQSTTAEKRSWDPQRAEDEINERKRWVIVATLRWAS